MSEEKNNNQCGCNHDDTSCDCENENCGCESDDCGCGHDHQQIITLTLDDDTTLKCDVVGMFKAGDKEYIALLPESEENVLLYQYEQLDETDIDLINIDDDDEFELVSKTFLELFDEE